MMQPSSHAATTVTVFVEGIGLLGPGLSNWVHGRQQLGGTLPYAPAPCVLPLPMALPPAERRRAGVAVKVSMAVGREAVQASGQHIETLASVFSSSSGDTINCHEICNALASSDRMISPTRFHNSVHNASSGYWSIASGSMASSSALCARDGSFAAALVEAMTQVVIDDHLVLLVAYDNAYPEPLYSKRPVPGSMGVALVLSPQRGARSLASIRFQAASFLTPAPVDTMEDAALESLRQSIPAARALPVLQAIAKGKSTPLVLSYLDGMQMAVEVVPC